MRNEGRVPGCFKYGCVGCLSLGAVAVALIFLASAVHLTVEPGDPQPEDRQITRDLPQPPEPPAPRNAVDAPAIPETLPLPELEEFPRAGRIVLDLSMGEFIIRPGPAGRGRL